MDVTVVNAWKKKQDALHSCATCIVNMGLKLMKMGVTFANASQQCALHNLATCIVSTAFKPILMVVKFVNALLP